MIAAAFLAMFSVSGCEISTPETENNRDYVVVLDHVDKCEYVITSSGRYPRVDEDGQPYCNRYKTIIEPAVTLIP